MPKATNHDTNLTGLDILVHADSTQTMAYSGSVRLQMYNYRHEKGASQTVSIDYCKSAVELSAGTFVHNKNNIDTCSHPNFEKNGRNSILPMAVPGIVDAKMDVGSAMSPDISTATVMLPPPSETTYGVLMNLNLIAVDTQA